jgi:hypothetical protein
MAGTPAEQPPPAGGSGTGRGGAAGEPQHLDEPERRDERFGPVAIMRRVKDDGRALILYVQAGHEQT